MKTIYLLLLAIFASLSATAQSATDKITVNRTNSSTEHLIQEIDSITFANDKQYIHKNGTITRLGVPINDIENVIFDVYHESEVGDVTLADNAATDQAKRIYRYLQLNYGVNTLSSVIADVNWNNKEAEKIYQATGKYPAINCCDFIHIHVPDGNGWIDYNDITPISEWVGAGGLVALMWHFNVPLTETTVIQKNGSGGTVRPDETTFQAANALVSGTWESTWFYQQADRVADVLLKLQNAGIAALWRPFHEAAGNATAKGGWGKAWFWWGANGADTYKQLWIALFDYLREKGVHNLIYVWTTQNYNGNSSNYDNDADWYPGDAYVDIVGRDLYGYTATQNEQEFSEIQARYPTKMIALAECGNNANSGTVFAQVADIWNAGARWSWFMPWYGSTMPNNSWWSATFQQSFVITRDKVNLNATYVEESAASAVRNMGLGWNLGNTLDSNGNWIGNNKSSDKYETAWGQPITKPELMTFMKKEGFNAIRVPITWYQHLDSNDNIDESWMQRVQEIVDYVINNGMYCILNVHHDTGADGGDFKSWLKADIDKFDEYNTRFVKIWQQIATRFRDYDQHLLFEGYNEMLDKNNSWTEPKETSSYAAINQYAQSFVNTVRETGGNNATRNLIVNTYSASHSQKTLNNFNVPTDNVSGHLIAEIHSYDPYNWFNTAAWTTACSNEIKQMFSRLNTKFVSKGIPVVVGEYGTNGDKSVSKTSSPAELKAAADHAADMVSQAKAFGIATFYWMGLTDGEDRSVPQWSIPTVVEAMKEAWQK